MGQIVSIYDWASGPNGFKEPVSKSSLHKIAKYKQTYPPAIKHGRRWVIDEDARFIGMACTPELSTNLSGKARQLVEKALNGSSSQKI